MKKLSLPILLCFAALAATAQDDKNASNLTGSWKFLMHGDHSIPGGLTLEQTGTKVKGTFMFMNNDIPVEGEFSGGAVSLSANAKLQFRGGGEQGHGADAGGTKLKIEGKMTADGTLAGEMVGPVGPIRWSAERFKERKVAAQPKPKAAGPVNLAGAWTASAESPQGAMIIDLVLKQDGNRISGSMKSDHSGELPLEGMTANGTVVFFADTNGGGAGSIRLEVSAKVGPDGTLAGELAAPMGKMPWTASRVK